MRNVTGLLFAIMFLALGQPSHADGDWMVGVGSAQCGQFLDAIESNTEISWAIEEVHKAWMQGYLSGMNVAAAAANKRIGLSDRTLDLRGVQGQFRWVKDYCSKNPLEPFGVAVNLLFVELAKQQTRN